MENSIAELIATAAAPERVPRKMVAPAAASAAAWPVGGRKGVIEDGA